SSQVISRHEMAPAGMTGEVVHGAGLQKSLTPAPVATATHSEEPEMLKSQKGRTLAATTLFTTCVGCVSGPPVQPPPPVDCPPGVLETYKRFGMETNDVYGVLFDYGRHFPSTVRVKDGPISARNTGRWGRGENRLPDNNLFLGRLFVRKNRVYGRLTALQLPNGETLPVCLEMGRDQDLGLPVMGGTPDQPVIPNSVSVQLMYPDFN
ncbi:MAG: hypothetical protein ACXU86_02295, partial [Archangium sp.]